MNYMFIVIHMISDVMHMYILCHINDLHLFCGMPCTLNMTNVQLIPWAPSG